MRLAGEPLIAPAATNRDAGWVLPSVAMETGGDGAPSRGPPRAFGGPAAPPLPPQGLDRKLCTVQPLFEPAPAGAAAAAPEPPSRDQDGSAGPAGSAAEDRGSPLNPAPKAGAKHSSIIVSPRQRGNPILKFVRNVPWEFGEVVPDYVLGQSTCALFLSLRYHNLNPTYIHERLRNLGKTYLLRVLLLQVDVKDPHQAVKELAKICILADCTLILAWSPEEAGRYLETYKAYEQKPADLLKEKVEQDYLSRVTDCLTSVKSVNRTDALSLLSTFGSLASIVQASKEDLSLCPGIGPQKAKRLFDILHEPFLKAPK